MVFYPMTSVTDAIRIFRNEGGTLRTSDALKMGIHPRTLYRLRDDLKVTEISRGVYRLTDLPSLENGDLVAVAKRAPSGVVCLISALHFHGITTEIPHEVYIAVRKGKEKPHIVFPPVRAFHFSPETYAAGIEEHIAGGVRIKVYSPEKTVADCFKFRNRIGLDVAVEAAKMCLAHGGSLRKILKFAEVCRVAKIIRPYLEAIQ